MGGNVEVRIIHHGGGGGGNVEVRIIHHGGGGGYESNRDPSL